MTFHDFFAHFAAPAVLPYTDFLMKWGHLLIGLSLVFGFMIRVSGPFGILLMITYYFAHMDWPYIENHLNFCVDFHLVYAVVIVYLVAHHAGHVWGLDGMVERLSLVAHNQVLKPLFTEAPLAPPLTRDRATRPSFAGKQQLESAGREYLKGQHACFARHALPAAPISARTIDPSQGVSG